MWSYCADSAEFVLLVMRALAEVELSARVWALTRGAVCIGRSDAAPDPVQAAVWGLGRVAALELPERWGGLVDLPGVVDGRALDRLVGVVAEAGVVWVRIRWRCVPRGSSGVVWCVRWLILVVGGGRRAGRC